MLEEDARKGAGVVCARCQLEFGLGTNQCGSFTGAHMSQSSVAALEAKVACRDRELATVQERLRKATSMLETVTRQLSAVLDEVS